MEYDEIERGRVPEQSNSMVDISSIMTGGQTRGSVSGINMNVSEDDSSLLRADR